MKDEELLARLEDFIAHLGIDLRYENGDFEGGVCRVKDKKLLIVNNKLLPSQKVLVMSRELATLDLSNVFVLPAIRELIDNAVKQQGHMEV